MYLNANLRENIRKYQSTVTEEKESWDRKRETMKKDLEREINTQDTKKPASEKPKDAKAGSATTHDRKQNFSSSGDGDGDTAVSESTKSSGSSAGNGKNSKKKKKSKK